MSRADEPPHSAQIPLWVSAFTYALMGPACAINGAFIALSVPAMSAFGTNGLIVAAAVGAIVGIWPAHWLARRIADGIRDDR